MPRPPSLFNALKEMTEGTNPLIHMLSHDDWFAQMADLVGELRPERSESLRSRLAIPTNGTQGSGRSPGENRREYRGGRPGMR
jgi:hypothetical protein